jgi:flagellar biosynthetic protein FliR
MAVVRSYERIPLGSGVVDMLRQARLHEMGAQVFASAFWMALPLTVLLLLANLALGIMSRIAPQMNIFAIGFPITLVTGLGGLALTLPLMDRSLLALLEGALSRFWFVR